uniref:Uncharacterized protein n=1 Tax=Romanomermis culicivorax TaxID=13658 RepID=A0A915IWN8_ROMCU
MGKQRIIEQRRATTDDAEFDNDNSLEYDDPDLELSQLSLDESMLRPFKGRRRASTGSSSSGSSGGNCRIGDN